MKKDTNFWSTKCLKWENTRYDSVWSSILFSSLNERRDFSAWVISQIPDGSRVVEIGCGSGRIFAALSNKERIAFTGYDISASAIELARNKFSDFKNADWICAEADSIKNLEADFVFSAGLLDWISDEQITKLTQQNSFHHFWHSFSVDQKTWKTDVHRIFSKALSLSTDVSYEPRKFNVNHLLQLFKNRKDLKVVTHARLSFGAFIHNFPSTINTNFESYLTEKYFSEKQNDAGVIETYFKEKEAAELSFFWSKLRNKDVLEIGSGWGFYTKKILDSTPKSLTCIDPAVHTPNFANGRFEFSGVNFERFTPGRRFDAVLALGVIEFVFDLDLFVKKLSELATKETRIYLLIPNQKGVLRRLYLNYHRRKGHHVLNTELLNIAAALAKYRLKVVDVKAIGPLNELLEIVADG